MRPPPLAREPRLSICLWVALSLVLGKDSSSVSQKCTPSSRQDLVASERASAEGLTEVLSKAVADV